MRKIFSLMVLALLSTGGVALANPRGAVRDHRSAGVNAQMNGPRGHSYGQGAVSRHRNAPVVDSRAPVYGNAQPHRVAPVHANNYNAQPVHARDGRFDFSGGISYVAPRPPSTYYYDDYSVRPAPYNEEVHAVAGYTWVPGNWQWTGSEWTWMTGYYQPIANHGASISFGAGYGH